MKNPEDQFMSLRGRLFDTEAEANQDNREYLDAKMAAKQTFDQQMTEATTHTGGQLGWIIVLAVITFFIPCLWPLTLGLVWWIIRRLG